MLKIVYMGTPDFAVGPLEAVINQGYEIAAIVTAPDKPSGRGRKLGMSEVKKFALAHDLTLLQPTNLKDSVFINILKEINPDLIIVIAFRMLPEAVWRIPSKGTINLHASLLPQYRGAAPINWALINGETQSGITTFYINENIDTGDIILQETTEISENDNFETLHNRLKKMGENLLIKTLKLIEAGNANPISQKNISSPLKTAPKLNKDNTRILWENNSKDIFNLIRGLSPFPGAWTTLIDKNNKEYYFKILDSNYHIGKTTSKSTGFVITDSKSHIHIVCGDGVLQVNKLQLSGRNVMTTSEFLRGYADFLEGAIFK